MRLGHEGMDCAVQGSSALCTSSPLSLHTQLLGRCTVVQVDGCIARMCHSDMPTCCASLVPLHVKRCHAAILQLCIHNRLQRLKDGSMAPSHMQWHKGCITNNASTCFPCAALCCTISHWLRVALPACCCVCRDDFDPEAFENQAALGLLQRFVSNGREADGSPTRDRLKMIVR